MNYWMKRVPNLSSRLPSRDQLLEVIGLELRRRSPVRSTAVFALGVLAGGFLALLLAPEASLQLRERLAARRSDGAEDAETLAGAMDS
jgi:hypothetical protein